MAKQSYFTKDTFKFLEELEKNNNRTWFEKNKARYEKDLKEPMLEFIEDFDMFLKSISPNFVADRKTSMFRIYRDTRFSKDKSPYKTWIAAKFNHVKASNNVHAPGFYLHIQPGESLGGGGLWHPEPADLQKVREAIAVKSVEWKKIRALGFEIEGEKLKRAPNGFSENHEFIEDIKNKDFYTGVNFTEKQVTSSDFLETYLDACKKITPLVKFLTKSLNLPW